MSQPKSTVDEEVMTPHGLAEMRVIDSRVFTRTQGFAWQTSPYRTVERTRDALRSGVYRG